MNRQVVFVLPAPTLVSLDDDAGIRLRTSAAARNLTRAGWARVGRNVLHFSTQSWHRKPPVNLERQSIYVFPFWALRAFWWTEVRRAGISFVVDIPESLLTVEQAYRRATQMSTRLRYVAARLWYRLRPPDPLALTAEILSAAAGVVCSSGAQRDSFKDLNSRCTVIHDAFPTDEYAMCKLHLDNESCVLLWVGQASTLFQLEVIAEVVRQLQTERGVELLVVTGPDMGRAARGTRSPALFLRRLGLRARVAPWQRNTVSSLMMRGDIGLAPVDGNKEFYWSKGPHRVQLYQFAGIPVVGSKIPSYCTWIRHGETGLLAGDSDQWRQSLAALVGDCCLRAFLGRNGALQAWAACSEEAISREWARFIGDVTT